MRGDVFRGYSLMKSRRAAAVGTLADGVWLMAQNKAIINSGRPGKNYHNEPRVQFGFLAIRILAEH